MTKRSIAGVIPIFHLICPGQFVADSLSWNDWKVYSWCTTHILFAQASLLQSFYHGMTVMSIVDVIPIFHSPRPVYFLFYLGMTEMSRVGCNTHIPFAQASLLLSFYYGMLEIFIAGSNIHIPFALARVYCRHSIME